jgi:RNA polymerase sigma-70 factor (ECF subfamily)
MTTKQTNTHSIGGKHGATCHELLALLNDYVDGKVDPGICKELEAHLAGCNPCQVVVDNIRKTITLYRNDQPCELPIEFRNHLHAALRDCWKKTGPKGKP